MPRTFSEHERAAITEAMLRAGAAMLRKKSIRQISVEEITKAANIAKGSFYSFYNSREELFWDIIKTEERQMVEKIIRIAEKDLDLKTKARKIFYDLYLDKNCIIYFLPPEDIQYIVRKLPPGFLKANHENSQSVSGKILSTSGVEASPENIAVLQGILDLLRSANTMEEPARKEILGILVEGLVDYFTKRKTTSEE